MKLSEAEIRLRIKAQKKYLNMRGFKFRPIFDNHYFITACGNLFSVFTNGVINFRPKKIKLDLKKNGYGCYRTSVQNKKKTTLAHRLVAFAFLGLDIGNRKLLVHHLDKNRANNNVRNLKVCTHSENNLGVKKKETVYQILRNL